MDARKPAAAGGGDRLPVTPLQAVAGAAVSGIELPVGADVCGDAADAAIRSVLERHPALRARLTPDGQEIGAAEGSASLVELERAAARPAPGRGRRHGRRDGRGAGPPRPARRCRRACSTSARTAAGSPSSRATRSRRPLLAAAGRGATGGTVRRGDGPPERTPYPVWAARLDGSPVAEPGEVAEAVVSPVDLSGAAGLLAEAAAAYRLTAEETALATLALALRRTGDDETTVAVEADLRADGVAGLDATGTVGPLAAVLPIALADLPDDLDRLVRTVKDARRSARPGATGTVLLRHAGDLAAGGGPSPRRCPCPHRITAVTVVTGVAAGELVAAVSGADGLAQAYAAAAAELTEHCRNPEAGGVSVSDFPLAGLDDDALSAFLATVSASKTQE